MAEWRKNKRRRKALLAPMASEPLVAYALEWPLRAEHRRELSVGDVYFDDRYWSQGAYPPLHNLVGLDEWKHFHPEVNPYFDERFLYGHRRQIRPVLPGGRLDNLVIPEAENDPATFKRLKQIITETTPSGREWKDLP